MKILILSCNNGGGHNAVAAALKERFSERGDDCCIVDAMSFLPAGWSKLMSETHSFIYRHCQELYRSGYSHAEEHRQSFQYRHSVSNLMSLGARSLKDCLVGEGFDAALCTNVFAGVLLSITVRKYALRLPTGIVETDYTATPGAEACLLDWHFVPSAEIGAELERLGVPAERIVFSGIPVRRQFSRSVPKERAKLRLGLRCSQKHIVLSCGSMGCGPMEELLSELAARLDKNEAVTVVCGTNRKRRRRLEKRYRASGSMRVLGKVENMSLLLDSADVYVTKPGGISTTEAACKAVPMVLVDTVGGCEQYNLDYFVHLGGAVTADSVPALAEAALQIVRSRQLVSDMSDALRRFSASVRPERIVATVEEWVKQDKAPAALDPKKMSKY